MYDQDKCFRCDICNKSFSRLANLKQHVLFHTEKSHSCSTCDRSFTLPADLKRHQRIHTGEKPYRCEICEKLFRSSGELLIHIRYHTGDRPYKCETCGKSFVTSSSLKIHSKTHTVKNLYKCKLCGKSFSQSSNLKRHYKTHIGVKPYICNKCGKCYTTPNSLNNHVQLVHDAEQSIKLNKCEICERRFSQPSALSVHMRVHTGDKPYECGLCGVSFTQVGSLKKHLKTQTCVKLYSCVKCKQSFTFSGIQHHKRHAHKETKADIDSPNVHESQRAVSFKAESKRILRKLKQFDKSIISIEENSTLQYGIAETSTSFNKQEDVTKKQDVPGSSKSYVFTCVICNKTFGKLRYLRRHIVSHSVELHYCDTCGKSFRSPVRLNNHKRKHSEKKSYICDLCKRQFSFPSTLSYHMQRHTRDKHYKCKSCGKSFLKICKLRKHYSTRVCVQGLDNAAIATEQNFIRNNEIAETRIESIEKANERKKLNVSMSGILPSPNIKRYISSEEAKQETEDPKVKLCDQAVDKKVTFKGLFLMSKQFDKASKSMEQSSTLTTNIAETSIKSIDQVHETKNSSTQKLLEPTEMSKSVSSVTKLCNLDLRRRITLSARNKHNENV